MCRSARLKCASISASGLCPKRLLHWTPAHWHPTTGPENRYSAVLFVEKEGFNALLAQARIAERFDIAIMSTKGMSTTAARLLLDRLAPRIDKVLVAHDFDVSGFSIFGTLGSDGRRYRFHNDVHIVDLGLRLSDVEALGLDSEPVETSGDWAARAATLAAHGASMTEISFLRHRRVELNAMPADVFVRFLERKLAEHGIGKVVPGNEVLEQHARHVLTRALTNKALDASGEGGGRRGFEPHCLRAAPGRLSPLSAPAGHSLGSCGGRYRPQGARWGRLAMMGSCLQASRRHLRRRAL